VDVKFTTPAAWLLNVQEMSGLKPVPDGVVPTYVPKLSNVPVPPREAPLEAV
jgi:hypothetical protein